MNMSKGERNELQALSRKRARVAKAEIEQRKATLLADFEQQLATKYDAEDERWRAIIAEAQAAVDEINERIQQRLADEGVPQDWHPGVRLGWFSRGENAIASRRVELRKVAKTRLDERAKAAKVIIDRQQLEIETKLIAGGLESADAQAFFAQMASVDDMLPPLTLEELDTGDGRVPR